MPIHKPIYLFHLSIQSSICQYLLLILPRLCQRKNNQIEKIGRSARLRSRLATEFLRYILYHDMYYIYIIIKENLPSFGEQTKLPGVGEFYHCSSLSLNCSQSVCLFVRLYLDHSFPSSIALAPSALRSLALATHSPSSRSLHPSIVGSISCTTNFLWTDACCSRLHVASLDASKDTLFRLEIQLQSNYCHKTELIHIYTKSWTF